MTLRSFAAEMGVPYEMTFVTGGGFLQTSSVLFLGVSPSYRLLDGTAAHREWFVAKHSPFSESVSGATRGRLRVA